MTNVTLTSHHMQKAQAEKVEEAILGKVPPSFYREGADPMGTFWSSMPRLWDGKWITDEHTAYQKALDIIDAKLNGKVLNSYDRFGASIVR